MGIIMKKTLIALGTVFLLSGCVGLPEKDVKLQFLNNNAEVVKELKIDDYEIMDGELKYRIGKKVYISQYAPFIIEGEKSTED